MIPFPALPEVPGVFHLSFVLFSTLNANNGLFQAGSFYCSSVFGVFLVLSCNDRVSVLLSLTETAKTVSSDFIFTEHRKAVGKKILGF